MSRKYRHLMRGSHLADSMSWNLHKMLCVPLQCSAFITAHDRLLKEANSASATYLFQQDKFYDVTYDTGDKSLQCGRKIDGFKVNTFKIALKIVPQWFYYYYTMVCCRPGLP